MTPGTNFQKLTTRRAFTLVELMVALTAGIFFTVFVFMMSKDAARFFQGQSRSSETTLASITGFERLRADIARAGFMASPNLRKDANRCPRPPAGSSPPLHSIYNSYTGLKEMSLAHIYPDTALRDANAMLTAPTDSAQNSMKILPDQLVMWGNYKTAELFPVRSINTNSASRLIKLETSSNALRRIGVEATVDSKGTDLPILKRIFEANTILRIVDEMGREHYSIIESITNDGGVPTILLKANAPLVTTSIDPRCALKGHVGGASVNPVDMIRYKLADLRSESDYPQFAALFLGSTSEASLKTRLELVRQRLDPSKSSEAADNVLSIKLTDDGDAVEQTELVAEYAVDLKFGLTVQNSSTGALSYLGEGDSNIANFSGLTTDSGSATNPHLIRGIHARLVIRSREADRSAPALTGDDLKYATPEDLIRVQIATGQYARTRSLRSHIITRNSRNALW